MTRFLGVALPALAMVLTVIGCGSKTNDGAAGKALILLDSASGHLSVRNTGESNLEKCRQSVVGSVGERTRAERDGNTSPFSTIPSS